MDNEQKQDIAPVWIVVLNWNAFEDTNECLLSLRNTAYPNYHVIVVDNGSSDDSPQKIAVNHPGVTLVKCEENKGIAAGYNRGIQFSLEAGAEYIVVMNNDLIFAPEFLTEMVNTVQAWPQCGVVMPKIYYYDEPDIIWSTGGRTRWMASNILLRDRQKKDGPTLQTEEAIDFAPSCCLLLTRELCQNVLFDENYFFTMTIGIFAWHHANKAGKSYFRPLRTFGTKFLAARKTVQNHFVGGKFWGKVVCATIASIIHLGYWPSMLPGFCCVK